MGDGILAMIECDMLTTCGSTSELTIDCSGYDFGGGNISVVSEGRAMQIVRVGDLDCSEQVTIEEIVKVVRMYLGQDPVDPICDPGCDNEVQIFDVIKAINCYLETVDCPCGG